MAPKAAGHITYSAADYAAMLKGFEGVIDNQSGTGYAAFAGAGWNQQAFPLAGKTGTASVNGEEPVSWFVGFGPLPDPQYVVVVDINEGGYGVDAAAPVVRNIFNYLAAHPVTAPGIPPDPAVIRSPSPVPLPTAPSTTTTTRSRLDHHRLDHDHHHARGPDRPSKGGVAAGRARAPGTPLTRVRIRWRRVEP